MKSVSLVSLKDQAAAALRREIYAGELPDGAELRQEDIAAQLGSRQQGGVDDHVRPLFDLAQQLPLLIDCPRQ